MSSFLWISVLVKCGGIIVIPRKVLLCSFEDTFGDIVNKMQLTSKVAIIVYISSNAMLVDPSHDVPLNATLSLCDQFKCMFVCINVAESDNSRSASTSTSSAPVRNGLAMLMAANDAMLLPPTMIPSEGGKEIRKDQQLYNDLLSMC